MYVDVCRDILVRVSSRLYWKPFLKRLESLTLLKSNIFGQME